MSRPVSADRSLLILLLLLAITSCRALIYNIPDISDHKIFPYRIIENCPDSVFYFESTHEDRSLGKKIFTNHNELLPDAITLDEYINNSKAVAFLIIRDDTVLYQKYKEPYDESSIFNTFSVTKIFITTLIGIAIREGYIESINQHAAEYIPELAGIDPFNKLTIRHLLLHTSGICFSDIRFSPFSDNSSYYYGRNLRKLVMKVEFCTDPGKEIHYSSANMQLLGLILERATGKSPSSYLEDNIWKPLGMKYPATWSLDNNGFHSFERCFSGINCTATDMARLGRLYLKEGTYNKKQIIPKEYFYDCISRDTTDGSSWNFQYNLKFSPKEYESFYSSGLFGQLIYICPKKNLIIVRVGKKDLKYNPQFLINNIIQIIDQI